MIENPYRTEKYDDDDEETWGVYRKCENGGGGTRVLMAYTGIGAEYVADAVAKQLNIYAEFEEK